MRRAWPLVALLPLLAGCGGSGGDRSFFTVTTGSVAITFAAGTGYNGNVTTLSALTGISGSATGDVITVEATANDRAVEIALVAPSAKTGAAVDLSGSSGSGLEYTDSTARGKYHSTSGTVTVTSRTTNSIVLTLTNVVVTSENTSTTSGGQGSATLNGTVSVAGQ